MLVSHIQEVRNRSHATAPQATPKVSVLIPCRNEVRSIDKCIRNVFGFEKPGGDFEVIVIDGMSDDGTREALEKLMDEYPNLSMLDNPRRTVPHAMNLGIEAARGEIIIRTDVRCIHPVSYLRELVEISEQTGADNVGGVLEPIGETYTQKSIAAAYKSRISMGGALRDRGDFVGETDAVYGGCFKKARLKEVGMYDEAMVRNQDDELSFRLRKSGGKIIQSGSIRVQYYPRGKYRQLFKQFLQYGYWKVTVIKKHPKQASVRHIFPSLLILGFLALAIASLANPLAMVGLLLYTLGYLTAVGAESLRVAMKEGLDLWPGITLSIVTIHVAYGAGFLAALASRLFGIKPRYFETLSR